MLRRLTYAAEAREENPPPHQPNRPRARLDCALYLVRVKGLCALCLQCVVEPVPKGSGRHSGVHWYRLDNALQTKRAESLPMDAAMPAGALWPFARTCQNRAEP